MSKSTKKMIKEIIVILLSGLIAFVFLSLLGFCGMVETHYEMECKVISVDGRTIAIEDKTGETWIFSSSKDFEVGDKCKVTFFTKTTTKRYDDEIVKVKNLK